MPASSKLTNTWLRIRVPYPWQLGIAFLLRLAYILLAHTYRFKTSEDHFSFGFEMGRIGRSLALGQGFSNPFHGITGPTAWEPPVYPLLIAGVFKLFGIYTAASAIILLAINSLFSALTCIPIFLVGERSFGDRTARWASWLWAILPPIMFWSTRWVWETSLATLLLTVIFLLTLKMENVADISSWICLGALWALAALTNTSLLAFLPASALWICYWNSRHRRSFLPGAVVSLLVFAICIAPWLIRNYETFGRFIFIRSNFGAELRMGNGPGADGTWMESLHPTKNAHELHRYRERGELAYVTERKREALNFIQTDYRRFALLCGKRFIFFWGGLPQPQQSEAAAVLKRLVFSATSVVALWGLILAIRNRRPGAWLFVCLIVCYPVIFYIAFPHPRYRHPIEPEILMLIVYGICERIKTRYIVKW